MRNANIHPRRVTINERTEPHTAGSTVTGTMYATIDAHAKKEILNNLTLYFIGEEVTAVTTNKADPGSRTSKSKRDIVRMIIPITDTRSPTGMHQKGEHGFPFQVRLPETLPSSMYFQGSAGQHARIRYKVKVEARREGPGNRIATEEVVLEVVAKPPSNNVPVPKCIEPTTSEIRLWGLLSRGNISFTANVSDTNVAIGEAVEISLGCRNESKTIIENATFSVIQKVKWCANNYRSEHERYLADRYFSLDDDTKKARSGNTFDTRKNNDSKITFVIPPYALQSYVGQGLINIEHKLKIKVKTPYGSNSLKEKINIQIVPPRQNAVITGSSLQPKPSAPPLDGEDFYPVPVELLQSDTTGERPLLDEKYIPWTLPPVDWTSPPEETDTAAGAPFTYKW